MKTRLDVIHSLNEKYVNVDYSKRAVDEMSAALFECEPRKYFIPYDGWVKIHKTHYGYHVIPVHFIADNVLEYPFPNVGHKYIAKLSTKVELKEWISKKHPKVINMTGMADKTISKYDMSLLPWLIDDYEYVLHTTSDAVNIYEISTEDYQLMFTAESDHADEIVSLKLFLAVPNKGNTNSKLRFIRNKLGFDGISSQREGPYMRHYNVTKLSDHDSSRGYKLILTGVHIPKYVVRNQ